MSIAYKDGYCYQLQRDVTIQTLIPPVPVHTHFLDLGATGLLTIRTGYAWDGPSGPAFHTRSILRGTLVHDALCQLIHDGYLHRDQQPAADRLLFDHCRQDGMSAIRAGYIYLTVRLLRGVVTRLRPINPTQYAPDDDTDTLD